MVCYPEASPSLIDHSCNRHVNGKGKVGNVMWIRFSPNPWATSSSEVISTWAILNLGYLGTKGVVVMVMLFVLRLPSGAGNVDL